MKKLFRRRFIIFMVLMICGMDLAVCYARINTPVIRWSGATTLVFSGVPNEIKSGEVSFRVDYPSGGKRFYLTITGTAFINGDSVLDTEYQADNGPFWHQAAGNPLIVLCGCGEPHKIRFRAKAGPEISSQQSGEYAAKLSYIVSSQ